MPFTLPALPFDPRSFGPVLTIDSFSGHHQSHHGGRRERLERNHRQGARARRKVPWRDVIRARGGAIRHARSCCSNASQHWNHSLYLAVARDTPAPPARRRRWARLIDRSFGDMAGFKAAFVESGARGSTAPGWIWAGC